MPPELERKLFLYAGLLEVADKGFDEISSDIDKYIEETGRFGVSDDTLIDAITLNRFLDLWAEKNNFPIKQLNSNDDEGFLISDLKEYGISNFGELKKIIPENISKDLEEFGYTNKLGVGRVWMLVNDFRKNHDVWKGRFTIDLKLLSFLERRLSNNDIEELKKIYRIINI